MSIPQEELKPICEAIGFITINWALMERQFDNCIHLIHTDFGRYMHNHEKPIAYKKKSKYLRKAFRRVPHLDKYKANGLDLIQRADSLSELRHRFTHGTIRSLDGTVLTIDKLSIKDGYQADTHVYDFMQFPKLAEDLGDLVMKWGHLSSALLDDRRLRLSER